MAERGPEPERGPGRGPEPEPGAARAPEREPEAGSRLREAAKAIGCVILGLIVLAIAVVVGVFDIFF